MSSYTDERNARQELERHRFRVALWLAVRLFIAAAVCFIAAPFGFRHDPATWGNVLVIAGILLVLPSIVAGIYAAYFFYESDQ